MSDNNTRNKRYKNKTPEEVFNIVYDINDWSSSESKSGLGSTLEFTENTREQLPKICEKYNIRRVIDVACGDFNWMKEIVDNFEYYKGVDIVKRIIQQNILEYYVKDKVEFEQSDICNSFENNGNFDAIIAKDVLVHFPNEYVIKVLEMFKSSGIKYLFLTHFNEVDINLNIKSFGQWRPLNFTLKPFKFTEPLELISEHEPYIFNGIEMKDKTLSFWKISDLINKIET